MQNDVCKNEISKGSFWTDAFKLTLVLRIDLQAQADSQNKASDARDESRQKCVEGKSADETTVDELNDTRQEHIGQVGIDDL